MSKKLDGKFALITGGTTGIGLATAKLFHAEGARVLVTGADASRVARAREDLEPRGNIEVVQSDAGDGAQIEALFERVEKDHGGIDVLFLNAGIGQFGPITSFDEQLFDDIFRINVKGPWLALRAAGPRFRRGGAVVLNTSINNVLGKPGSSAYAASKAALRSLARTAATEFAEQGVRVNAVSPGPIETPIYDKLGMPKEVLEGLFASMVAAIPLRRIGRAEEIARAALFLSSDDSSFMTGEEIVVDGGMTRV